MSPYYQTVRDSKDFLAGREDPYLVVQFIQPKMRLPCKGDAEVLQLGEFADQWSRKLAKRMKKHAVDSNRQAGTCLSTHKKILSFMVYAYLIEDQYTTFRIETN